MTPFLDDALARLSPSGPPGPGWWLWIALGAAVLSTLVPALWLRLRLLVTLTHELGHAVVGLVCGRRFKGFVVNRDMSGHALTSGKPTGFGLVASTWAGYPAPGVLGAGLVAAALAGGSRAALAATALALLLALVAARSWGTAGLVLLAAVAAAAAAWYLPERGAAGLVVGLGAFLLLGAWRHVGTVLRTGGRGDDPAALARATRVPAWLWVFTFALALGACTWWAAASVLRIVQA